MTEAKDTKFETTFIHTSYEAMAAREKWLKFWLAKALPPVVTRWAESGMNLDFVGRYLDRKRVRMVKTGMSNKEMLMVGNEVVATFEVKFTIK